jgi:predicted DNA-binding antitoxin AbrB/MazE fold protein
MLKTIKARYRNGLIEPLEKININEGMEITITISEPPIREDGLDRSFGGWKGLIDADIDEMDWLRSASNNPAFDFLKEPEEDIYTLADGRPFNAQG